jgi:hypothetical protein
VIDHQKYCKRPFRVILVLVMCLVFASCGQSQVAGTTGPNSTGTPAIAPTPTITDPSTPTPPPQVCKPPMPNPPTFNFPLPPGTVINGVVGATRTEANLVCTLGQTQDQIVAFMTTHLSSAGYHLIGQSSNDQYAPQCQYVTWVSNDETLAVGWFFPPSALPNWTLATCAGPGIPAA